MKVTTEMIPEKFITFDNGVKARASRVLSEIGTMEHADVTDFIKTDEVDMALFELVKEKCAESISEKTNFGSNIIRIHWNLNTDPVTELYNLIYNMIYENE